MKPEFVKINEKKYKINTDFRVALKCDEIARDETTGEYEKGLAVIYKLFGDEGLNDKHNHEKLLELGKKYLLRNQEKENDEDPDMDFEQDRGYIKASFFSDYKLQDIYSVEYMHWYDFYDYLLGLTEDCVLSRVRYIRSLDTSGLTGKELDERIKQKKAVELKKKQKPISEKQSKSANRFLELAKLK